MADKHSMSNINKKGNEMRQKSGKRKQKENKEKEKEKKKILLKKQDNKPYHLNYLLNLFPKGGSSVYS